jgi:hypothetical protein
MLVDRDKQLKTLIDLVHRLPAKNYNTLKFLMEHLEQVHQHSKENKMSAYNLSVVFGPNLLRSPKSHDHHLQLSVESYVVIQWMIEYFHIIFEK